MNFASKMYVQELLKKALERNSKPLSDLPLSPRYPSTPPPSISGNEDNWENEHIHADIACLFHLYPSIQDDIVLIEDYIYALEDKIRLLIKDE